MRCHVANIVAAALKTAAFTVAVAVAVTLVEHWCAKSLLYASVQWKTQRIFHAWHLTCEKKAHSSHDCKYFVVVVVFLFFLNFFLNFVFYSCFVFSLFVLFICCAIVFVFGIKRAPRTLCGSHADDNTERSFHFIMVVVVVIVASVFKWVTKSLGKIRNLKEFIHKLFNWRYWDKKIYTRIVIK